MTASEKTVLDPVCCEFCGPPLDENGRSFALFDRIR